MRICTAEQVVPQNCPPAPGFGLESLSQEVERQESGPPWGAAASAPLGDGLQSRKVSRERGGPAALPTLHDTNQDRNQTKQIRLSPRLYRYSHTREVHVNTNKWGGG